MGQGFYRLLKVLPARAPSGAGERFSVSVWPCEVG
jgi:hypothetical protein